VTLIDRSPFLLLLLAVALLSASCVGPSGESDPSLRHDYSYEVSVTVDRPVDDLVLRVPLPSVNGSSALGEALANGTGFGVRPGWKVAVVEANGTPLLELQAERFLPEYRGTPIALVPGEAPPSVTPPPPATARSASNPLLMPYTLGASIAVNRTIETRDPAGREPLLGGGSGPVPIACDLPGQGAGVRCSRHPVAAFADYRADAPANVSVGVRMSGSNQWWRGGWTFNHYTDGVVVEFPDGERGWARADAVLTAGEGTYA
jgi:hypothetical protein